MSGKLIILTGPSGCGKDSVRSELLKKYTQASKLISFTTRKPRLKENDGIDYHFVDIASFEKMKKEGLFLEDVTYADNYYGTAKQSLEPVLQGKMLFWIMDVFGAFRIKTMIKKAFEPQKANEFLKRMLIIFIDIPNQDVYQRLSQRGEKAVTIQKRLEQDLKDKVLIEEFENIIENKNGNLEETIRKIDQLIKNFTYSTY